MSIVTSVHGTLAWSIPVGFGIVTLWSIYAFARNRPPAPFYWTLLGALQVVLGVQILLGAVLFLSGTRAPWLHYAYGGLFPVALLVAAHRLGRRYEDIPWVWFGIASALIAGLTIRAVVTGRTAS